MSLDIKIDRSVPMPKKRAKKEKRTPKSDIAKAMDVGDSIFIATIYGHKDASVETLRKAFRNYGMKCTCRKVEGGVRIWRTE